MIFYSRYKKFRLDNKISLEDIQRRTKIDLISLKAIEAGKFSEISNVYVRLFFKAYLKEIGIDIDEGIEELDEFLNQRNPEKKTKVKKNKTEDVVESIGIKKAYEKAENAQLIIFLIDSNKYIHSKELFLEEIATIKQRFPNKRLLVIANKIDTLSCHDSSILQSEIENLILLSAKQNIGVDELKQELISLVNTGALSNNETIVTNSRHFEALNHALESINSVKNGIDLDISSDLFAIDIRECLRHLGNITGEYDVDKDILGHIFGNFCIGK